MPAKGKPKVTRSEHTLEEQWKLEMQAANAASQSLTLVVQSDWKALGPQAAAPFSMNGVLSIVSSFRSAISLLREHMPGSVVVERVASCFVGKLVAVQLYELALELLDDIKAQVVHIYYGSLYELPPNKPAKSLSPARFMHLIRYPIPAPTDPVLLGLIASSLGHALTALAALVSTPSISDNVLEIFTEAVGDHGNPVTWQPFLPTDHGDTLMARAYKALTTVFTPSNTPSSFLLKLRTWALRFLLRKTALDPEQFWAQATNYIVSHGRSSRKSEVTPKVVDDVMLFFDSLILDAQERRDTPTFMSGPALVKFCEVTLVVAQRCNSPPNVNRIVRFITAANPASGPKESANITINAAKLYAQCSRATALLEDVLRCETEDDVVSALTQCADALSASITILSSSDVEPRTVHSVERLRRVCNKILEEAKCQDEMRNAVKFVLAAIVQTIETIRLQPTRSSGTAVIGLTTCAVDSLCTLSKADLSPVDPTTHTTAYNYLRRAGTLIDTHASSTEDKCNPDSLVALAKMMRYLSQAFWNRAVMLYQDNMHAPAVRYLIQTCEWGAKACTAVDSAGMNGAEAMLDLKNEAWRTLKAHLPKRWELLGECYSKIGDRKLAYSAMLEALKAQSFESICYSAASSPPGPILSDTAHRRLASLVERITYVAVFDLLMGGEASLRQVLSDVGVSAEAIGLILEWQVACLDESLWKDEVPPVVGCLLRDALEVYGAEFPIRRARVLLLQLEFAYRADDLSAPITDITAEIQRLLSQPQDRGKDSALTNSQLQYQALTHIWLVFHAHRRSEGNSHTTIILQHATLASKILRGLFPAAPAPPTVKSPKTSPRVVAAKARRTATRASPRKRTAVAKTNPVTPKPRKSKLPSRSTSSDSRKSIPLVAIQTPPKASRKTVSPKSTAVGPAGSVVDRRLATTIQMLAQLMGLLGHTFLKIKFLNILQRMSERSMGPSADDFVRASVDAAVEYTRLGKTQRALAIYTHALAAIDSATVTTICDETRVLLLLHYAEAVALNGNIQKSSSLYEEARNLAQRLEGQQLRSTAARVRARVLMLERSAVASNVFSAIQVAQHNPYAAFSTLRQSLRLWNRAFDSLARLLPTATVTSPNASSPGPFDMSSLAAALGPPKDAPLSKKAYRPSTDMGGLQWRVAEGLLYALLALSRAYFLQGSVRGAEFFIEQARDLAESLNTPAMLSRALTKQGELQLHQGKLEEAASSLLDAANLLHDIPGVDAADVNRLRGHHRQLIEQHKEAKSLYLEAMSILSELEKTLTTIDDEDTSSRKSSTLSPGRSNRPDVLVPGFLATVLRQQIWLQRNEPRAKTKVLLDQLITLPPSRETKAEELAILAKLALHDVHVQFRADLFLSSLAESTIAVPMGVLSREVTTSSPSAKQMLETLSTAEKMFWADLELVSNGGQVPHVREAAVSLALIRSFQTSLGGSCTNSARVAAGLLDASAAITLRREIVDAIEQKFPELHADDLVWPSARGRSPISPRALQFESSTNSDDGEDQPTLDLKGYWRSVRDRYYSTYELDDLSISTSPVDLLPANWTVVSISITEDKSTMFFSRQRPHKEPLIFCVPLERHGRKEEDVDEQFTYADAIEQLKAILGESNQSAEDAKGVQSQDRDAKAAWWAKRVSLDKRMRELLENIEFCWLGAFKTILSEPVNIQPEVISSLRARLDKVFKRNLASHKKSMSRMKLDDALTECFASLSPKCRDEELEDLVYFVLDLYQFHGVHVALSEIDMDQVTVELRTALEEHASKGKSRIVPQEDAHLFLVLDKNVQGIPWESIPILRGRSVSRVPSLSFLVDRIEFAKLQRQSMGQDVGSDSSLDRAVVNPKNTFYVLNPSGDLTKSETRFGAWAKEMEAPEVGWQGIVGRVPGEQELLKAFTKKDLVIYIGHGGAEQYVRSHKIKHLPRCAATMLWGCSSGLMRDMGDFDRVGTPYNYMLAGCPTLVACLWDVTDNDLDKFSRSVFDKLQLDAEHVRAWKPERVDEAPVSLVAAVGQSRDVCKLKYLTGAAPVVYGIPFYL